MTVGDADPAPFAWETGTNDNYRTVAKTFPAPVRVSATSRAKVALTVDVRKLVGSLDPEALPTIASGHESERATLSNNWASAFTLVGATTTAP